MQTWTISPPRLFPESVLVFPSTRYQGSKAKLVEWIWQQIVELPFTICLDAFAGTGVVAHRLKRAGKQVTYNDVLRFNYYIGRALVENNSTRLSSEEIEWLLRPQPGIEYPDFVYRTFAGIYFTDEENSWIDRTVTNIRQLEDPFKFSLAFFALCQSCIIKRPYNLFHRKNLYLRLANIERSFGNKKTWDRPFEDWFRTFSYEANEAVFDNGQRNTAVSFDAADVPGEYDLVYIDTPYISGRGVPVDYRAFYHFLEGLAMYDEWNRHIDWRSRHRRLKPQPTPWTDKSSVYAAFERLFRRYQDSILVISYRSDGIPSESALVSLLRRYKRDVRVEHYGAYKYALSTNAESREILLIGT
jgi:adenine-specific DNA methylase